MTASHVAAAAALLVVVAADSAGAQSHLWRCFSDPDLAQCRTYVALDLSAAAPVVQSRERRTVDPNAPAEDFSAFRPRLTWRLGLLTRVTETSDAGPAITAGLGSAGTQGGAAAMFRRPLGAADLALTVGYVSGSIDGYSRQRGEGIQGTAELGGTLPIAAALSYQRLWTGQERGPDDDGIFEAAEEFSLGLTVRQRGALYGTAGVGLAALVALLSFLLFTGDDY